MRISWEGTLLQDEHMKYCIMFVLHISVLTHLGNQFEQIKN